jgi:hypothetical protein
VRGEKIEKRPIAPADLREDRPHLTLPSPLPPGAEREDGRAFVVHPTVCSVSRWLRSSPRAVSGGPRDTRIEDQAGSAGVSPGPAARVHAASAPFGLARRPCLPPPG